MQIYGPQGNKIFSLQDNEFDFPQAVFWNDGRYYLSERTPQGTTRRIMGNTAQEAVASSLGILVNPVITEE